ncbi:large, multifunctional secreted protein (plasmid) [Rufibacter tibetensis]|uniref:Large, multifunctional secreted protein n=2 Tax=Rufibacter tibetensis TaxID=512763 RepID=A0A0P0D3X7_9BACT|nr:large, multifunctional secreted protein [Rufibacter tibetensis]
MKGKALFIHLLLCLAFHVSNAQSGDAAKERRYYSIKNVPIPADVMLEVGGLAFTEDDKLAVATRRGEIWMIDDPYQNKLKNTKYTRFASGLHETLYLSYHKGSFYTTQRSELTKITDTDRDGKADLFKTVYAWPLSGNYHEYSYGPLFLPNGDMLVNLNLSWEGKGKSLAKWRGWMLKVKENGEMTPFATGMRSPAGLGLHESGDVFYSENQGDWIGSGWITHVKEGDFVGHPEGLKWSDEPNSPVKMKATAFKTDSVGTMFDFAKEQKGLKLPAVWFPHTLMGISTTAVLSINSDAFGPFKGQLLVGDQGHSKIMRVFLEKVNGEYQGACFPFREGFSSGILRMAWGSDNSLFVGMTSRGWASTGGELYGLQRLVWNKKPIFEIKAMRALADGFELEFTQPVNKRLASNPKAYQMTGFTYSYQKSYGSPIINALPYSISSAEVTKDGRKVKLIVHGLREGYIHELMLKGIKSRTGTELLHPLAYYTLNAIPGGGQAHQKHAQMMTQQANAQQKDNNTPCGGEPSKNPTEQPANWAGGPDITITIGTKPGLKFSIEDFEVPEGSKVKLVFDNTDDMLHNLVITAKGKGDEIGKKAMELGMDGPKLGYVPISADVLFNTCLLQPNSSQDIYFVAPKAGDYPYVCTFPGHYNIMKGIMKVSRKSISSK